jgi:hypothetical protein
MGIASPYLFSLSSVYLFFFVSVVYLSRLCLPRLCFCLTSGASPILLGGGHLRPGHLQAFSHANIIHKEFLSSCIYSNIINYPFNRYLIDT